MKNLHPNVVKSLHILGLTNLSQKEVSQYYDLYYEKNLKPISGRIFMLEDGSVTLFTKVLCWCIGASPKILEECVTEEKVKYQCIGGMVLLIGILASMTGGYALYYVFENAWSIPLGMFWGLIIFTLDRHIVTSIISEKRKKRGGIKQLSLTLVRLIIVGCIAFIISEPLILTIFNKEIENHFKTEHIKELETTINDLETTINNLETKRKEWQSHVDNLRENLTKEIAGIGVSRLRGDRDVANSIRDHISEYIDEHKEEEKEYNELITQRNKLKEEKVSPLKEEVIRNKGLLARIDAFNKLKQESPSIKSTYHFLLLLFILLEIAPAVIGLISTEGSYGIKVECNEKEDLIDFIFKRMFGNLSYDEIKIGERVKDIFLEKITEFKIAEINRIFYYSINNPKIILTKVCEGVSDQPLPLSPKKRSRTLLKRVREIATDQLAALIAALILLLIELFGIFIVLLILGDNIWNYVISIPSIPSIEALQVPLIVYILNVLFFKLFQIKSYKISVKDQN